LVHRDIPVHPDQPDSLEQQDLLGQLDYQVPRELEERLDLRGSKDFGVYLEYKEFKVIPDTLEQRVTKEVAASMVSLDILEPLVLLVVLDHRGDVEKTVHLVSQV